MGDMTMMNEELIDPKDIIIGKLKLELERKTRAIEQFKNYDKKRKEYYSNLSLKVGELESYVAELEAGLENDAIIKLQEKNRRLSKEVSRLMVKAALDKYDEDEIAMATTLNKLTMNKELKELRKKVKDDKNTLNNLLGIINKYREKYGEL